MKKIDTTFDLILEKKTNSGRPSRITENMITNNERTDNENTHLHK